MTTGSSVRHEVHLSRRFPTTLDPYDYDAMLASPMEYEVGVTDVETRDSRCSFSKEVPVPRLHPAGGVRVHPGVLAGGGQYLGHRYLDGGTSAPIPGGAGAGAGLRLSGCGADPGQGLCEISGRLPARVYQPGASGKSREMAQALDTRHAAYARERALLFSSWNKQGRKPPSSPRKRPIALSRFREETGKGWTPCTGKGQEECRRSSWESGGLPPETEQEGLTTYEADPSGGRTRWPMSR